MPVALLNEIILMLVGMVIGYKTGKNVSVVQQFMKDNQVHSYKDALVLARALYKKATTKEGVSC